MFKPLTVVEPECKVEVGARTAVIVLEYPSADPHEAQQAFNNSQEIGKHVVSHCAKFGLVGVELDPREIFSYPVNSAGGPTYELGPDGEQKKSASGSKIAAWRLSVRALAR